MTTPLASGTTVSTDDSETTAAVACLLGDIPMNTGSELFFTCATSSSADVDPLITEMTGLKGAVCAGVSVVVVVILMECKLSF